MSESWIARWQEGRIGWHEEAGNASLRKYWNWRGRRVLVPLAGKSMDLAWLESRDNEVVGIELSEIAVRAFFEEQDIAYRVTDRRYTAIDRRITLVHGDYFEFGDDGFDAHFDRGAFVAVSPGHRERYAEHTSSLLTPDAVQLLITLEYDDSIAEGPPFSVPREEVLGYWPTLECVDAYDDLENGPPKFREAGLDQLTEVVWRTAG